MLDIYNKNYNIFVGWSGGLDSTYLYGRSGYSGLTSTSGYSCIFCATGTSGYSGTSGTSGYSIYGRIY